MRCNPSAVRRVRRALGAAHERALHHERRRPPPGRLSTATESSRVRPIEIPHWAASCGHPAHRRHTVPASAHADQLLRALTKFSVFG